MKKQIMSIAAIAALFTTGAMAFDTNQFGALLKQEGSKYIVGKYTYSNNIAATAPLTAEAPGQAGDALIYPAFFGDKGWETEFTVVNHSDEAMVAKVVFYSREDSKELKDFNIYLSANDVFRATVKEGKIIIKDSSFVYQGKTPEQKTNLDYTYTDTAKQASEAHPVTTDLPEGSGYISVYGMVQADDVNSVGFMSHGEDVTAYHKNHDKLWRDYRHLVDECRGEAWRGGIKEGIYDQAVLNTPNIDLTVAACGEIETTTRNRKTDVIKFKSPEAVLTGSVTLKATDGKGTRAMTLNAVPLTNFTDVNQGMLWTEGEFAAIADRDIVAGGANTGNHPKYDGAKVLADANAFSNAGGSYTYEYGSSTESAFVLTQPHKRTLIQLTENIAVNSKCLRGDTGVTKASYAWTGMRRDTNKRCLVTNYGVFDVNRALFDDNENLQTAAAGGFTFSPASVTVEANQAPGEVTMIANIVSDDDRADGFTSGYAQIAVPVPGIATHMTAHDVDGNVATNWIYSGSVQ